MKMNTIQQCNGGLPEEPIEQINIRTPNETKNKTKQNKTYIHT